MLYKDLKQAKDPTCILRRPTSLKWVEILPTYKDRCPFVRVSCK